jgi:2-keto-4-pentenoate hydratase
LPISASQPSGGSWAWGAGKLKRDSGVGRSITGRLLKSRVFEPGQTIPLPCAAPATIDFKFDYVPGQDVLPSASIQDARSVVASACVTFEVVLSRFVDRRAVGWSGFAADNAGFGAMIIGEAVDPTALTDVARTLVVSANGTERARAAVGDDETVPLDAVTDLLSVARERNMVLPRGSLVPTGSMSVPFNVTGPVAIEARFLDLSLGFPTQVP